MNTHVMGSLRALVAALTLTMCSCAADAEPDAARPEGPAPQETQDVADIEATPQAESFASKRYGYGLEVPPGWELTQYPGTWTSFDQFSPGAQVPGEDLVSAPDGDAFLVAGSMAIPSGMTPAAWLDRFDHLVVSELEPLCPGRPGEGTVAGVPATVVVQRCDGYTAIGRHLTHGGRGYYFTIVFPPDDATTGATLGDLVSSISFTEN